MEKEELTKAESFIASFVSGKKGKLLKLFFEGTPYVNTVYSGIIESIEKKKLIKFLQEWVMQGLDEKFNEHDPKQIELATHAVLKAVRCSHDTQIKHIIGILLGKFNDNIKNYEEAEDLINIMSELSENEAAILYKIYNNFINHKIADDFMSQTEDFREIYGQYFKEEDILKKVSGYSNNLNYYLGRLVGKGLLKKKDIEAIDDIDKTKYQFTHIGGLLFESIKSEDN